MPPINRLIKPASGLCNMRCDYCFYCDEAGKRQQASFGLMGEDTLKNVIRRTLLRAEGQYSIAFQGGEPTLCGLDFFRWVVRLTERYNKNRVPIHFTLQTNGYAITEDWARFFAEQHFLVGISIDGTKELHDRYRHAASGAPSYDRILQTTQLLNRCGVDYNILTVIHRDTAERIDEIYDAYRKRGWKYLQFITCLDPIGEERGKQPWSLTPEGYGQFLITLFRRYYQDLRRGQEPYIRQFDNYIGILLGFQPESCEQRGCCAKQYVIEADGSIYPCDFYALDEYRLGNLNEDRLEHIDAWRKEIGFLERSRPIPEACRKCRWFALCRNGCYRSRMTDEDSINYFCPGYRMFFENCFEELSLAADIIRKRMKARKPQ